MTHYKGEIGTSLRIDRKNKNEYRSDVFKDEREYYHYCRVAGEIERKTGLKYFGKTDKSLMKFVKAYKNRLRDT